MQTVIQKYSIKCHYVFQYTLKRENRFCIYVFVLFIISCHPSPLFLLLSQTGLRQMGPPCWAGFCSRFPPVKREVSSCQSPLCLLVKGQALGSVICPERVNSNSKYIFKDNQQKLRVSGKGIKVVKRLLTMFWIFDKTNKSSLEKSSMYQFSRQPFTKLFYMSLYGEDIFNDEPK